MLSTSTATATASNTITTTTSTFASEEKQLKICCIGAGYVGGKFAMFV